MFSLKASPKDILEYVKETKIKNIFLIIFVLAILLFMLPHQHQALPEMSTSKSCNEEKRIKKKKLTPRYPGDD